MIIIIMMMLIMMMMRKEKAKGNESKVSRKARMKGK